MEAESLEEEIVLPEAPLRLKQDERRACPRVPMQSLTLWFEDRPVVGWGDLSLGGAYWSGQTAYARQPVEIGFTLPDSDEHFRLPGEVLTTRDDSGRLGLHIRFTEVPIVAELAIARHIDDWMMLFPS